jgi:hypothetical protein
VDGWVTFGAGNRATGRREDGPDEPALIAGPTSLSPVIERNDDLPFDATVGAVGTALQMAGVPRIAFGARAALGLAAPTAAPEWGRVARAGRRAAGRRRTQRGGRHRAAAPRRCDDTGGAGCHGCRARGDRGQPPQQDTLLLMGLSDRIGPEEQPHLRVALALGPSYTGGRLGSALTRRDGFVQLIDAGPTVLALTGADRWRVSSGSRGGGWAGAGSRCRRRWARWSTRTALRRATGATCRRSS